jgi:Ras-related protein Rab-35
MAMKVKKDAFGQNLSYKFLVLGDQMVGKTSVLERYINRTFKENYLLTIGMDKRFKRLEINNTDVDIFITDTAGQERFRSLTKMFYKGADGILVGFSLTEAKTLESVNYWINEINQNCSKEYPISLVLFGNKCDDKENIQVKPEQIEEIKNKYNLMYFETSAKDNINIQNVFEYLTKITIMKRGNLSNIGLKEGATIDDIIIQEKENQKLEVKITKTKKKKFC